jgi:8-oxo-dGTP diphosphatase
LGEYPCAPQVAVGAVVLQDGRVLLVRRRRPPAEGQWAIPGGRVNLGESLVSAAEREILEETGLIIRAVRPVITFEVIRRDQTNRVRYHYVIVDFQAEVLGGRLQAGDDALEARWVSPEEMDRLTVNRRTRNLMMEQYGWQLSRR